MPEPELGEEQAQDVEQEQALYAVVQALDEVLVSAPA